MGVAILKGALLLGVGVVAAVLLAGCSLIPTGPSSNAGTTVVLTQGDNGSQVQLHQGDTLAIELDSNPTTGYRWDVDGQLSPNLHLMSDTFVSDANIPGAGGTQTLRFATVATGQATLQLMYHRPWEQGVPPIQTYQVQVTIN
jgi:inhibitor of cysteine peptidase